MIALSYCYIIKLVTAIDIRFSFQLYLRGTAGKNVIRGRVKWQIRR